jgi:pimeloyl-ACP methyl ester carboxylesterase
MKRTFIQWMLATGLIASQAHAVVTEQLVDLAKPNGARLRYLLTVDAALVPRPDTGVILFAGGQGNVRLADGIPQPGANFLVRTRHLFAQEKLVVAVYDPSPDIGSLSDQARMSRPHADEVAQVLAHLKQETGVRHIYLIGTSRGTISAAHLALALQDQLDGVVLTSTLFQASRAGPGLSGFDFSAIRQPLLFVHHVADACKTTPPHYARTLSGKYPVVWVGGQQESGGDACGPFSAHGYLGHESATVHAIAEWILQRKLPPADTVAAR